MAFCSASDSSALPNGFSLTGFNHVPWYLLKRMQIVNQTPPSPHSCFFIFYCCLHLVPCNHLAIIHRAFTFHFLFLQPLTYYFHHPLSCKFSVTLKPTILTCAPVSNKECVWSMSCTCKFMANYTCPWCICLRVFVLRLQVCWFLNWKMKKKTKKQKSSIIH